MDFIYENRKPAEGKDAQVEFIYENKKKKEAKVPETGSEYLKNAPAWFKNTLGAVGGAVDVVGGIPGAIAGTIAGVGTAVVHGDAKGGLEVAQGTMQGGLPSSILGIDPTGNAGYDTVMKVPTMIGEILHEAGKGYGEIAGLFGAGDSAKEQVAAGVELGLMGAGLKGPPKTAAKAAERVVPPRIEPTLEGGTSVASRLEAARAAKAPESILPEAAAKVDSVEPVQAELPLASSVEQIAAEQAKKSPQKDMFVDEQPFVYENAPKALAPEEVLAQKEQMWTERERTLQAERGIAEEQAAVLRKETEIARTEDWLNEAHDPVFSGRERQRGGINVKEISDEITKQFTKFVNSRVKDKGLDYTAPLDAQDYAQRIPGMGDAAKNIIPRPKDMSTVIGEELANGKDIPSGWNNLAQGPEMVGWKHKSALVENYSQWFQWAQKKSEAAHRTLIAPVESTFAKMAPKDMIDLAEVLKSEMFQKSKYTPDELAAAGLSQRQIAAHTKFRETIDTAYDLQAEALRRMGKEPPTRQEAHLASLRQGDYSVSVKAPGEAGVAWHVRFTNRYEANKFIEWVRKEVPGLPKDIKIAVNKSTALPNVPKDVLGGFKDLLEVIGEDGSDASLAIQAAIRDAQEKAGYNALGHSKRFLEKNNVRGFEGDMPWLTPKENATRLFRSQFEYLNNAYKWAYFNDALAQAKQVLSNPDLIAQRPNAVEYLKKVTQNHLGMQDHLVRTVQSRIMQQFGSSNKALQDAVGKSQLWTSMLQLGANTGHMIATPITMLNAIGTHIREGGTFSPRSLGLAMMDTSAAYLNLVRQERGAKQVPMTKLGRVAYEYVLDNQLVNHTLLSEPVAVGSPLAQSKAMKVFETTTSVPERMQRVAVFFGHVHGLANSGKFKNVYDLLQRAETLTNVATTNFKSGESPMMVGNAGVAGQLLFKYKAPILNYWNQLHAYGKDIKDAKGAIGKAKAAKALTGFLGMTAVLGGVQDLPFVNELDMLMNGTKSLLARVDPTLFADIQDWSVKDTIRDNLPEIAAYGTVQTALGAQMSQRFGSDVLSQGDLLGLSSPTLGMIGNAASSVGSLLKGNPEQALWNVAPQLVKGNLEVTSDKFKADGEGAYRKPSDISNPDAYLRRTERDETMRRFGLRSSKEANQLDRSFAETKNQERIKTASEKSIQQIINYSKAGDTEAVERYAAAWQKLNPGSQIGNALDSALERARLTPTERAAVSKNLNRMRSAERVMSVPGR